MATICRDFLIQGVCNKPRCRFGHPAGKFLCDVCEAEISGAKNWASHEAGRRHQNSIAVPMRHCETCNRDIFGGSAGWREHIHSERHHTQPQMAQLPVASWQAQTVPAPTVLVCSTCDTEYAASEQDMHLNSAAHKRKVLFAARRSNLAEAERDKHGVTVSFPNGLDFGLVELASLQNTPTITSSITATLETVSIVTFVGARLTNTLLSSRTFRDDM
jgi:hypothetical protein